MAEILKMPLVFWCGGFLGAMGMAIIKGGTRREPAE